MGQEAKCKAHLGRRSSPGKALLESDKLLFRGEFRLDIPLKEIERVEAKNGQLRITRSTGLVTFELGALAPKWALKIRNPKTLLDKLGVKPASKVSALGVKDPDFWKQVKAVTDNIFEGRALKDSDSIFIQADNKEDLKKLKSLRETIKRDGAIWVIAPKDVEHVKESDVLQAGKDAVLVDVKVVSFSETHTAHKFVIPLSGR